MNTAKIVRKFCDKTLTPYKQTLREVRAMSADQRGARLKAMKEFIANKNIALPDFNEEHRKFIESNGVRGMFDLR